jgi:hypothetical protein
VAFGCEFDGLEQLMLVCELARTHVDQTQAVIQEIRKQIMRCHELVPAEALLVRRGSIPKAGRCKQALKHLPPAPYRGRWDTN